MRKPADKTLKITEFGNPVLRIKTQHLSDREILSEPIQQFINDLKYTLELKKHGIGLAATQVGKSYAITVISIRPTRTRPDLPVINLVTINPEIITKYGHKVPMWEGCVSLHGPYALVPRYKKIKIRYYDEKAKLHESVVDGILAHVFQHEVDHLNGTLFVDRVEDTTSYMSRNEYLKMVKEKQPK